MTKTYKHKEQDVVVKVAVRRGKTVVTSKGMIDLGTILYEGKETKLFKGCTAIREDVLSEEFEEVA